MNFHITLLVIYLLRTSIAIMLFLNPFLLEDLVKLSVNIRKAQEYILITLFLYSSILERMTVQLASYIIILSTEGLKRTSREQEVS